MIENSNKSTIQIKCSDYEDGATAVFIHASNGFWAGGLTFYVENPTLEKFFNKLSEYTGSGTSEATLDYGEPNNKWAYYVKLEIKPRDRSGHTDVGITIIDNQNLNQGKTVELTISCTPPQANELGKLIKKSYLQRTAEIWEVPKNLLPRGVEPTPNSR